MTQQHEFPAELVERVARAIWGGAYDAMVSEAQSWGDDPNVTSAHFEVRSMRESALAALRALRDAGALVLPQPPRCPMKTLRCGMYVIETEPPMNPPMTACSNADCPRAIRAYAAAPRAGGGDE